MSGSDSSGLGPARPDKLQLCESLVEKEVASIKTEARLKVRDNIATSWAKNREKIRKSKDSTPALPLLPIPAVGLRSDHSSDEERGKKRVLARVKSSLKSR